GRINTGPGGRAPGGTGLRGDRLVPPRRAAARGEGRVLSRRRHHLERLPGHRERQCRAPAQQRASLSMRTGSKMRIIPALVLALALFTVRNGFAGGTCAEPDLLSQVTSFDDVTAVDG